MIPNREEGRMSRRFEGQVVLVTGAGSGIGRAAALRFAAEGAFVHAADWAETAESVADEIRAAGGAAEPHRGDAGNEEFVRSLVDRALQGHGRLDATFANAGISGGLDRLWDVTVAEWEAVLRVNLVGVFLAIRESVRAMLPAKGGAIVATASVAGLRSGAGGLPYSASKAGVINLVATSANQLAGTGIRVNALCPGLTETGMTAGLSLIHI
jgi:NAD(P)-dependent dehydrogenase (short-subunit alcohol dehydrogenase family)